MSASVAAARHCSMRRMKRRQQRQQRAGQARRRSATVRSGPAAGSRSDRVSSTDDRTTRPGMGSPTRPRQHHRCYCFQLDGEQKLSGSMAVGQRTTKTRSSSDRGSRRRSPTASAAAGWTLESSGARWRTQEDQIGDARECTALYHLQSWRERSSRKARRTGGARRRRRRMRREGR